MGTAAAVPAGQQRALWQVIDGILHRVRTGVQWRDLPERFGPWKTVYERHRLWSADGTSERLLQQVQAEADAVGEIDWDISIDSTVVRAHQHAAGARTDPPPAPASEEGAAKAEHQDETPGQSLRGRLVEVVLEKIRVPRLGPGRPREKPDSLAEDKAYSNGPVRDYLRRRGVRHTIPEKTDSQAACLRKGSGGGRQPAFNEERYKKRNTVERAINKLKHARAVATRYDKRGYVFLGTATSSSGSARDLPDKS